MNDCLTLSFSSMNSESLEYFAHGRYQNLFNIQYGRPLIGEKTKVRNNNNDNNDKTRGPCATSLPEKTVQINKHI